jgi:hypothetical protein
MPTGVPEVPRGADGRPLTGAALDVHLRKQAELAAAAGYAEDVKALARTVCRLAARALGGIPAPDALASLGVQAGNGGREDSLRVLRAAGIDPAPQARRWAEEAPLRMQASSRPGNLYAGDPEHDPRVTEAVLAGQPLDYVADLIAQITAERQRERDEAAAAAPLAPGVLWETRDGRSVRESPQARPLMPQRSIVRKSVPPLGEPPPDAAPPGAEQEQEEEAGSGPP